VQKKNMERKEKKRNEMKGDPHIKGCGS